MPYFFARTQQPSQSMEATCVGQLFECCVKNSLFWMTRSPVEGRIASASVWGLLIGSHAWAVLELKFDWFKLMVCSNHPVLIGFLYINQSKYVFRAHVQSFLCTKYLFLLKFCQTCTDWAQSFRLYFSTLASDTGVLPVQLLTFRSVHGPVICYLVKPGAPYVS